MRISEVVTNFNVKPGQPMRNDRGEEIKNTVSIDEYSFLRRTDDGGYRLWFENPITGAQDHLFLTAESFAVLKRSEI